jgi:hypothetical protein
MAASPERPVLWGVDPSRWRTIRAHVHYGLRGAGGATVYGGIGGQRLAGIEGASLDHPSPEMLVRAGVAKSVSDVRFVIAFPAVWDLQVWLIPNPNGAFADSNPDVVPSEEAGGSAESAH